MNPPGFADVITPAQIRAGRGLLDWSQDQLAMESETGISSVRDFESGKRAPDTEKVGKMRRALQNGGVVFVPGSGDDGPGVCLVGGRPSLIRRPTTVQKFEGVPFGVEIGGKHVTVFLQTTAMEDQWQIEGSLNEADALALFAKNEGIILDAVKNAFKRKNFNQQYQLVVEYKDFVALEEGPWHSVTSSHEAEIVAMMNSFHAAFVKAGIPARVDVYVKVAKDGERTFYFSPQAVKVGKAVLAKAKSTPCKKEPSLDGLKKVLL